MPSYVETSLMPNEEIVKLSGVHWITYVFPGIWFLISLCLLLLAGPAPIALFLFLIGCILVLWAWIIRISTEFAITTKRVIAKTGLVFRHTNELNLSRVESLHIHQGIVGRILNYGTVTVQGIGGNQSPLRYLRAPLDLRRALNEQIERMG